MNLSRINIIIGREYLNKVKKKSFLLTTFLVPVLFVAVCAIPSIIMFAAKEPHKTLAVIDESGLLLPRLESTQTVTFEDMSRSDVEEIKGKLDELGLDALVHVAPLDTAARNISVATYSKKPIGMDLTDNIKDCADEAVEDYRISQYEIDSLKDIMDDVRESAHFETYTLDDAGEATLSSSEIYMFISMALGMVIYLFVTMFSSMVMSSVTEEKSSRVVEVLVSSVRSTELMYGKIIGVALVAITQFVLWILLAGALGLVLMLVVGSIAAPSIDSATIAASAGALSSISDPSITSLLDSLAAENEDLGAVIGTLSSLKYGQIGWAFLIYFVLGYLLYAAIFAAIGSAVDNEADSNQLSMPLTIPLMIGFFVSLYAFKAPDSGLVFWFSMIPFTSPIVMLARIPFGVPAWQWVLSITILVASFAACAWASAKIYRVGLLMFGKKSTWADLWKWLRQK